ncbi:MAG TPA: hypothetical protein VJ464_12005 [Blastocatellia bacterium]|nr:hypothetical protein [Blastocatellia bacterium]
MTPPPALDSLPVEDRGSNPSHEHRQVDQSVTALTPKVAGTRPTDQGRPLADSATLTKEEESEIHRGPAATFAKAGDGPAFHFSDRPKAALPEGAFSDLQSPATVEPERRFDKMETAPRPPRTARVLEPQLPMRLSGEPPRQEGAIQRPAIASGSRPATEPEPANQAAPISSTLPMSSAARLIERPAAVVKTEPHTQAMVAAQSDEPAFRGLAEGQAMAVRGNRPAKLTINRLEVQLINQTPPAPVRQPPRARSQPGAPDSRAALERHHLGRFYLGF